MALTVTLAAQADQQAGERVRVVVSVENTGLEAETISAITLSGKTTSGGIAPALILGQPQVFLGVNDSIPAGETVDYITQVVVLAPQGPFELLQSSFTREVDIAALVTAADGETTYSSDETVTVDAEIINTTWIEPPSITHVQGVTPLGWQKVAGKFSNQEYDYALRYMTSTVSGKFIDATSAASWTSSDTGIATIANDPDSPATQGETSASYEVGCRLNSKGAVKLTLASGGASDGQPILGSTTIEADITIVDPATASVSVVAAPRVDLWIQPAPFATVFAGGSIQLKAYARRQDGQVEDVTSTVSWGTTNPSLATVTTGLVEANVAGSNTSGQLEITATSGGLRAFTTVVVYPQP